MSAPKDVPMLYAATCNPPRRAKRQRTSSLGAELPPTTPSPTTSSPQQRRGPGRPPILPKPLIPNQDYAQRASPESDSASDEEDDYDPAREAVPAPKRRGRKPGPMSRSARESLRKLNHSRIEKARRTKINETLAALSTLVGDRDKVLPTERQEVNVPPTEDKGTKGKDKAEEKEFKLDVLVKTVEYMNDLVARVQVLETNMCTQCRVRDDTPDVPPSPKRRRPEEDLEGAHRAARRLRQSHDEEDPYGGDDEHGLGAAEEEQPSPMPFANPSSRSTASPRLPPIASWLPHPYVDPSSLITSSPNVLPVRSPQNAQLPSPPPSGRFRPAITLANMPALTLPAPAHPLAPPSQSQSAPKMPPPRHQQRKSVSTSPAVSPTWTPEDETAASLLLHMSSKPRSLSTSSTSGNSPAFTNMLPMTPREEVSSNRAFAGTVEVATPRSLLGMRD